MAPTKGRKLKHLKFTRIVLHLTPAQVRALRVWLKKHFRPFVHVPYAAGWMVNLGLLNPEAMEASLDSLRRYADAEGFNFERDVADARIHAHPFYRSTSRATPPQQGGAL